MAISRSDVVAWYELQRQEESNTVYDEHAQLDGTVNGATLSNDTPSNKFIGSHNFDGTDDYITLPNDVGTNAGRTCSVSMWIRSDSLADTTAFWMRYGTINLMIGSRTANNITSGSLGAAVQASGGSWLAVDNGSASTATWYHVVVVSDESATSLELYINGSSVDSRTDMTYDSATETAGVSIGAYPTGTVPFNGNICGVDVFSKALTATEVSTLYNSGDGITYRELFPLSDDLEAYYKLDGDATDASGNGNNGTISGATSTADSKIGTAYDFDGTNDYIELNDADFDYTGDFTISGWFNSDVVASADCIVGKGRNNSEENWVVDIRSGGAVRFFVRNSSQTAYVAEGGSYSAGVWTHFSARYNSSANEIELFVDGASVDVTSTSGTLQTNSAPAGIGGRYDAIGTAWGDFFDGKIDEVLFFERRLTDGEIRRLHSFGAALRYEDLDNTSPLVDGVAAAYNFDGDVTDAKNNTFDGTNNGSGDVAGVVDRARRFDGVNDVVEVSDNGGLEPNTLSVGVWSKSLNVNWNTRGILSKRNATNQGYLVHPYVSTKEVRMYVRGTDSSWYYASATPTDITLWHQYGFSYDKNNVKAILDGTTVGTTPMTVDVFYAGENLHIGEDNGNFVNADIDNTVIWGRALSSTEWNAFYSGGSGVQYPFVVSEVVIPTPIAAYNFNGNANDETGTYDGTVNGATLTSGKVAWGYDFDGTNDYIQSNSNFSNNANITVSSLYNNSSPNNFERIASYGVDSAWDMQARSGDGLARFYVSVGSSLYVAISTTRVDTGDDFHIVGTYDGSDVKIYINGSLEDTTSTGGGGIDSITDTLEIGRRGDGAASTYCSGVLSTAFIFDSALSSSQVSELYNSGTPKIYTSDNGWIDDTHPQYGVYVMWKFEDSKNEVFGIANGDNATMNYTDGNISRAVQHDSINYLPQITSSSNAWIPDDFTIAGWFYIIHTSSYNRLLNAGGQSSVASNRFGVYFSVRNPGDIHAEICISNGRQGINGESTPVSNPMGTGWHFLVLIRNGTTFKALVDNVEYANVTISSGPIDWTGAYNQANRFFNVHSDSASIETEWVGVWKGEVNSGVLTELYASGSPGSAQQYPFVVSAAPGTPGFNALFLGGL